MDCPRLLRATFLFKWFVTTSPNGNDCEDN